MSASTSTSGGTATADSLPAGALPDGAAYYPGSPPGVVVAERPWRPVEATLALICAILLLGPPAVICGHLALRKIKKSNGLLPGKAEAWIGLGIGYPVTAVLVLFLGLRVTVFFMSGGAAQL